MLPVAVVWAFAYSNTIRYVLPVLWMTSCLPIIGEAKATLIGSYSKSASPGGGGKYHLRSLDFVIKKDFV